MNTELSKADFFGSRRNAFFTGKVKKRRKNEKNSSGRLCQDRQCPHCVGNWKHSTRKRMIPISFDE